MKNRVREMGKNHREFISANILFDCCVCAYLYIYITNANCPVIVHICLYFALAGGLIGSGFPDFMRNAGISLVRIIIDSLCKLTMLASMYYAIPHYQINPNYIIIAIATMMIINFVNRKHMYEQLTAQEAKFRDLFDWPDNSNTTKGKSVGLTWILIFPSILIAPNGNNPMSYNVVMLIVVILLEVLILYKLYKMLVEQYDIILHEYITVCIMYGVVLIPIVIVTLFRSVDVIAIFAYFAFCASLIRYYIDKQCLRTDVVLNDCDLLQGSEVN